ncbi:MAG: hypothetical protein JW809_03590 [Pirellulales bacterium]|nr:hypothetical protein [Pirellulales bacterium]
MSSSQPDSAASRRDEAARFLFGRIDYERTLAVPYRPREFRLDRMEDLLRRLGSPRERLGAVVHVAGTKGKGSVTAMVQSVLTRAGYRTGAYTSPHVDRIEERIALDGRPCSAEELVDLVARVRPAAEEMDALAAEGPDPEAGRPTFFEVVTAVAMRHFADRSVDATVLEVGLGGRLDATNVCRPAVTIITSISLDHTQQLGGTLAAIAGEKAGIIKPGVPLVSGVVPDEPRDVIRAVCRDRGAPLIEMERDFTFAYRLPRDLQTADAAVEIDYRDRFGARHDAIRLGLLGAHQAANAAVALAALGVLRRGGLAIAETALREGLAAAVCPARIEVVGRRPVVIIDAAHNRASAAALVAVLRESFAVRRRRLLFAATLDKDLRGMLDELLPVFDDVVFTKYSNNPRGADPAELARLSAQWTGRRVEVVPSAADAWAALRARTEPEDLVCATGSFFLASELRPRILAAHPGTGPGSSY